MNYDSGFNTPHTHLRATELTLLVKGRMISEFVAETGARKIRNEHNAYSMVVFPQGALHLEFNPGCDEAIFIAVFNSEDRKCLFSFNVPSSQMGAESEELFQAFALLS
jgi:hypothetical protein